MTSDNQSYLISFWVTYSYYSKFSQHIQCFILINTYFDTNTWWLIISTIMKIIFICLWFIASVKFTIFQASTKVEKNIIPVPTNFGDMKWMWQKTFYKYVTIHFDNFWKPGAHVIYSKGLYTSLHFTWKIGFFKL